MNRVRHSDGRFEVLGLGSFQHRNEETFAPLELIQDVSAVSLRDAIWDMVRYYDWDDASIREVRLTDVPLEYFDRDFSPRLPTTIKLQDDEGLVVVQRVELGIEEDDDLQWLNRILEPLAKRLGTSAMAYQVPDEWPGFAVIEVTPPNRGRTVGELIRFAEPFGTLAEAARGKGLTPATAASVLRGAHPQVLLGQSESQWLEAKRTPPRIDTEAHRVEFAKDVAAFANTRSGGLLVYGLRAATTSSGDVINRVTPFRRGMMVPTRLTAIVRRRVHPYPLGLEAEVIRLEDGRCIGIVLIPPQPEARKPFLVSGAVIAGRVRGTYVGVPIRAGEDTIWDDVAGIHALMVAGRVALNRLPD
jgi:hypothetical protein